MNKILIRKEIKKELSSTIIWTVSISFYLLFIVFLFPSLKETLGALIESFQQMPGMDIMFGVSSLPITQAIGFYGMEAGVIISLGGSIFAGVLGGRIMAKEEKEKTIEFLATNPIKRKEIFISKFLVCVFYITVFNIVITTFSSIALYLVDPDIDLAKILLFHLMQLVLHLQIGIMGFTLSVFGKKASTSKGTMVALIFYSFFTILNILDNVFFKFLRYLVPFTYADPVVLLQKTLNFPTISLLFGVFITSVLIYTSYATYNKKDVI